MVELPNAARQTGKTEPGDLFLATVFALKRTSLGSVLDCVAPCLEESLLSLAKLRLEEVWKSFTEHTKCVDVWLKNDSEKGP